MELEQSRVTLYGIKVRCSTMTAASVALSRHNAVTTDQHPAPPPTSSLVTHSLLTTSPSCEASTLLARLISQCFFALPSATEDRRLAHWRYYELLKGQGAVCLLGRCYFDAIRKIAKTPWLLVRTRTIPSDRRFSAKLVSTFADRGCRVVSATNSHGR
jgi:hypothetical protein